MSTIIDTFSTDFNFKITIEWDSQKLEKENDEGPIDLFDSQFKDIYVSKVSSCKWPEDIKVTDESTEGNVEIEAGKDCIVNGTSPQWTVTPDNGAEYFTLKIKAKNKKDKKEKKDSMPPGPPANGDPDATVTIGEPPIE